MIDRIPRTQEEREVQAWRRDVRRFESIKIGDEAAGNYFEIERDGSIVLHGDSTMWEDLNFDVVSSGGPAATNPDYVTINNVVHREFTSANNQFCGKVEEYPHAAKLSSLFRPHIHIFLKSGESVGTTGVSFTFYWELRQASGVTSGSVVMTATSAQLTANPVKYDIYDIVDVAGPTALGSQLAVTIKRTAGNAGDIVVLTYGIHYEIDSIGSRGITVK